MNFLSLLATVWNINLLCSAPRCSSLQANPLCPEFQNFVSKALVTVFTPFVISCTSPSSLHVCRLESKSLSLSKEVLHAWIFFKAGHATQWSLQVGLLQLDTSRTRFSSLNILLTALSHLANSLGELSKWRRISRSFARTVADHAELSTGEGVLMCLSQKALPCTCPHLIESVAFCPEVFLPNWH